MGAIDLELPTPLADSIIKHWNQKDFNPEILDLNSGNYPQIYVF